MRTTMFALCFVSLLASCASAPPPPSTSAQTLTAAAAVPEESIPDDPIWKIATRNPPGTVFRNGNDACVVGRAQNEDPEIGRETAQFAAGIALGAALGITTIDELMTRPYRISWWLHLDQLTHDTVLCVVAPDSKLASG